MKQTGDSVNGLFGNKVQVIQALKGYRVSEDAVILTWFACPRPGEFVLDAGTGCGAIAFGLAVREPSIIVIGLEIQDAPAVRAAKGVRLNRLSSNVGIVRGDFREADNFFRANIFDLVVCNPPYHELGRGRISHHQERALSRHEMMMPLKDLFRVSSRLLKGSGRLSLIYPASGIERIRKCIKTTGFEVERMLWIHPHEGFDPSLVCVEAIKDSGRPPLVESSLFLYDDRGERTQAAKAILSGEGLKPRA
ncbi:MAG: methyltransferase [Desulfomonilaceae bacterium]